MKHRLLIGAISITVLILSSITTFVGFRQVFTEKISDTEVSWAEVCGGMWFSQGPCPTQGAIKCDGSDSLGRQKIHICYPNGYVARDSDGNFHVCGTGWLDTNVPCSCGDGHCINHTSQENSVTCPQDCGSVCGDGACNGVETSVTCAQDCPLQVCGDGDRQGTEQCDDGNTTNGDGCSSTCQTTTACSDGVDNDTDGRVDCVPGNEDPGCFPDGNGGGGTCGSTDDDEFNPICGNRTVETGEQCDDGNVINGDGCSSTCQTTTQCNDGVDNDGDGRTDCSASNPDLGCYPDGIGGGGTCNGNDNTETDVVPVCGDGNRQGAEQCDDGNLTNGDGCSSTCQTTTQCNDGVDNDNDGRVDCSASNPDPGCFPNGNGGGGACNTTDNDEFNPICGNGTVETGEQCDDNNIANGDGCSSTCQTTTACNDGVDNDGDGSLDCSASNPDPGCFPDGNGGGGECNTTDNDEFNPVCGNGSVETGEQCDDQNVTNGDGCSSTCQTTTQCNDGVDNDGDGRVDCTSGNSDPGCFPDGRGGGGSCDVTDPTETNTPAACGDGVLDPGEGCDNGTANAANGAACNTNCQLNTQCNDGIDNDGDGRIDCVPGNEDLGCFPDGRGGGGSCNVTDPTETNTPAACGDGVLDVGEGCDNGTLNAANGAVCNTNCQLNAQCNDGIDNDGDGRVDCTSGLQDPGCFPDGKGGGGSCSVADTTETNAAVSCGDGVLDPSEQCDNGSQNSNSGAPCNTSCQRNVECNDGIDNDNDGRIDCVPGNEDPGCFPDGRGGGGACSPSDAAEVNSNTPLPNTAISTTTLITNGLTIILLGVTIYHTGLGDKFRSKFLNTRKKVLGN